MHIQNMYYRYLYAIMLLVSYVNILYIMYIIVIYHTLYIVWNIFSVHMWTFGHGFYFSKKRNNKYYFKGRKMTKKSWVYRELYPTHLPFPWPLHFTCISYNMRMIWHIKVWGIQIRMFWCGVEGNKLLVNLEVLFDCET